LIFVGANAVVAMISYLVVVGPISRLVLEQIGSSAAAAGEKFST
jgi:hypothetical protein